MVKTKNALAVIKPIKPPSNLKTLSVALAKAKTPEQVVAFERQVAGYEAFMRAAGYPDNDMRMANEAKLRARWKLGGLLSSVKRGAGVGRGKKGVRATDTFSALITRIGIARQAAAEAQQISHLPKLDLERRFRSAREAGEFVTVMELVEAARPWWDKGAKLKKRTRAVKAADDDETVIPAGIPLYDDQQKYKLIHGSIVDGPLDIGHGTIDCIVTDPPYPEEFIPLFRRLAERSLHWLRPGGSLVVMSGQVWLPQVLANLDAFDGLNYHWTLAYLTPGGQAVQVFPRRVNTFWKPVFWFVKGDYDGAWIGDVTKSDVNANDKNFHGWGQSESGMVDLIGRVSKPGETILDPFCGGGTTGIAAVSMGRKFIGIDVSAEAIAISAERLLEVTSTAAEVADADAA